MPRVSQRPPLPRRKLMTSSNYLITVNTHLTKNKIEKAKLSEEVQTRLQGIIASVFKENPQDYIIIVEEEDSHDKVSAIQNWIKFEYQEKNKSQQAHSHNYLKIKHSTKVRLDYDRIRDRLKEMLRNDPVLANPILRAGKGEFNPHIHIQMGSYAGTTEKQYMEKDKAVYWSKEDVAEYYKKLREEDEQDPEKWNRFESVEEIPQGFDRID